MMNPEDPVLESSAWFGLTDTEDDDFEDEDEEKVETLDVELLRFGTAVITRHYFSRASYPLENPSELLTDFENALKSFLRNCGRKGFIFLSKIILYPDNHYDYRRVLPIMCSSHNPGFAHTFTNDHVLVIVSVKFFNIDM